MACKVSETVIQTVSYMGALLGSSTLYPFTYCTNFYQNDMHLHTQQKFVSVCFNSKIIKPEIEDYLITGSHKHCKTETIKRTISTN